jgi:hypothetical protein
VQAKWADATEATPAEEIAMLALLSGLSFHL